MLPAGVPELVIGVFGWEGEFDHLTRASAASGAPGSCKGPVLTELSSVGVEASCRNVCVTGARQVEGLCCGWKPLTQFF